MPEPCAGKGLLRVGGRRYTIFRLAEIARTCPQVARLPFCLKVLLENVLRAADGPARTDCVAALASWDGHPGPGTEVAFRPVRVLLQDLTGVPAVVDLAAMRDAVRALGATPAASMPCSAPTW
jgi:aconitate hydratase